MSDETTTPAPKKFVGLHCHDGFSTFDGLNYPNEHIDFVRENGMDAWALTNHGNLNSYAHAQLYMDDLKKKGVDFKFIPGVEFYLHPDLKEWKRDHESQQAARDSKKLAEKEKKKLEEEVVSPLEMKVDEDDEAVDVEMKGALTVEDEDESKKSSTKLYDPVKRRHHLVVLPKNSAGLKKIFKLVSRGFMEGFYKFPRIDYGMLKEAGRDGDLIVSTACLGGPMSFDTLHEIQRVPFEELHASLLDDPSLMAKILRNIENTYDRLADCVGADGVFLELQFNKLAAQHLVNRSMLQFARDRNLTKQLVVTADSHYARPEYWKEREIYKKLGWLNYSKMDPSSIPQSISDLKCELYPKNASQVWQTYQETKAGISGAQFYDDELVREAIERTHDIAHQVIGKVEPDRSYKLPTFVVPEGSTPMRALMQVCKEGMIERGLAGNPEYIARLKKELEIVKLKDFALYFLTMKEIIAAGRDHLFFAPGRGSSAGSLINYILRITDVDPIKWELLFERFLSPERATPPDIDTDVSNRDRLIELMRERLGRENVIPISNYNTFKLLSLVKDLSRFYGIPFEEVGAATRTTEAAVKKATKDEVEDKNLFVLKFDDAMKYSPPFAAFIEKHPQLAESIRVLFKQVKSLGKHAGGVLVSENIADNMPLIASKGDARSPWVEGLAHKNLEFLGFIKFDMLGLETLRIIERAIELILRRHEGNPHPTFLDVRKWYETHLAPDVVDFNDQRVYEYVYHAGRWAGIFQCTERGAQKFFVKAKPKNLIDVATLTSIYRPGPLGAKVDDIYIGAKEDPDAVEYHHPLIKQVLEETFGCVIFQEQIMQLAHVVGGFPLSECDKVRKLILKRTAAGAEKGRQEALALREKFVKGAVGNGIDEALANELYDKILFFAGYGFNKSHAVAYAMDSFFCAWLMTYYEAEWLCAYLESMSDNPVNKAKAFGEVRGLGYSIVNIDIAHATTGWTILEGKRFMPSMTSCKGIGGAALEELEVMRPLSTLQELLWNPDGTWRPSKFNKKALDSLIKLRAFSSMDVVGEGKLFASYRHMHHVIIENLDQIKKSTKRDPFRGKRNFDQLAEATREEFSQEWDTTHLVEFSQELLGSFDVSMIFSDELQGVLAERNVVSVDEWGMKDEYWFVCSEAIEKRTRNGKPYLSLSVMGLMGKVYKMFCWNWDGVTDPKTFMLRPLASEIDRGDFGLSTSFTKMKVLDGK